MSSENGKAIHNWKNFMKFMTLELYCGSLPDFNFTEAQALGTHKRWVVRCVSDRFLDPVGRLPGCGKMRRWKRRCGNHFVSRKWKGVRVVKTKLFWIVFDVDWLQFYIGMQWVSAFCRDLLRINHMPKGLIKEGCFQRIERDCKLKSTVSYLVPSNDKNDKHRRHQSPEWV